MTYKIILFEHKVSVITYDKEIAFKRFAFYCRLLGFDNVKLIEVKGEQEWVTQTYLTG